MAICFSFAHKAEWPLFSFFSSLSVSACLSRLSHCPRKWHADFGTLFVKRSQTSTCFGHFSINGKASYEDFLKQAHKWALTNMCDGIWGCHMHPTKERSNWNLDVNKWRIQQQQNWTSMQVTSHGQVSIKEKWSKLL